MHKYLPHPTPSPSYRNLSTYTVKKVPEFPVPSRDVTTKLSLGGNNDVITELFLPKGSLVSDIPAGDKKLVNLFLRCIFRSLSGSHSLETPWVNTMAAAEQFS
jgi:hypothetical protein